jgi:hypothetical protein
LSCCILPKCAKRSLTRKESFSPSLEIYSEEKYGTLVPKKTAFMPHPPPLPPPKKIVHTEK